MQTGKFWKMIVLLILLVMPVVLLFTVFAEPMVSKARAKKLEEEVRNPRNYRHVYSLLTGTAAIAADTL